MFEPYIRVKIGPQKSVLNLLVDLKNRMFTTTNIRNPVHDIIGAVTPSAESLWKRKPQKNRDQILRAIDSDMFEKEWHQAVIVYDARHGTWFLKARKHQTTFLLLYMSLETLKEDLSRVVKLL